MTYLPNTAAKLASKQAALVIGYFGGSITEGAGASKPDETSWRALTTQWFRETYAGCQVSEISAAIGGTGSDLGVYRCDNDLLAKKPDLVFVEFAVNDWGMAERRILRSMEGIVRQIKKANPEADIIFVYTVSKDIASKSYDKDEIPQTVVLHQKIADHYGIPSIHVGKALWQKIQEGEGTWEGYLADGVHPSDEGYKVYAKCVGEFLQKRIVQGSPLQRRIPEPLVEPPIEEAALVDAWSIPAEGWVKEETSLSGRYPHRIACSQPGTELVFKFSGTSIGLYWLIAPDSGDIEWSIDNMPVQSASSWDKYALRFTRANYVLLQEELEPGEHTLRLVVSANKAPESKGTYIRIGAMLVGKS